MEEKSIFKGKNICESFLKEIKTDEFYSIIFPIEGISLGKTTQSDVFRLFNVENNGDFEESIAFKGTREDGKELECSIWFSHGIVKTIGFANDLPEIFDSLHIRIEDSYNKWRLFLEQYNFKEVWNDKDSSNKDFFLCRFYNPFEGLSFNISFKKQDFNINEWGTISSILIEYDIPDEFFDDENNEIEVDRQTKSKCFYSTLTSVNKLYELIGLKNVKNEVNGLANLVKVQKIRQERNMKSIPVSYHCVFTGNPGTGKTTVARLLAQIYKELGILSSGHLIETDRSGLVAEYVGQTAIKTNAVINTALDGVLFIDEAYSLVQGGDNDFGKEAISTLLKRMEDDRDRLVVILAGYSKEMEDFINSNSGLQSRFTRYIHFPDYTTSELLDIFCSLVEHNELICTDEALNAVKALIENAVENKDEKFGNGRYVRNLFERVLIMQANRIANCSCITDNMLRIIEETDING